MEIIHRRARPRGQNGTANTFPLGDVMADSEIISRTKITCMDIEIAVANYFGVRANLIVPNVSWGLWIHECDLLVVTKAGYCYEVEIKTNRSDLKADMRKQHRHESKRIRRLYFAIPTELLDSIEFIPTRAGILEVSVRTKGAYPSCKCIRDSEILPAQKLSDAERFQVARLGTMRIFPLKEIMRHILSVIKN
jgi:hypothetical protein